MLKRNPKILGKKILEKYNIDLTSHNISIKGLIDAGKSLSFEDMAKRNGDSFVSSGGEIFLLSSDLLNTEVAQKLWNELNVYEYRFLINDANYCGDPTNLNNYAKTKEEEFILNTDYPKIYQNIFNMINKLSNLDSSSNEYRDIFRNLIRQIQIFPNEYTNLRELIFNGEFAEKYLKQGTKIAVTGRIQTGSYTNKDGNKVYIKPVKSILGLFVYRTV